MRARLLVLVGLVAAGIGWASTKATAETPSPAPSQSVGIRLVDAPTERADDPRARLYIVDHLAPGTTIHRRVEVNNDTDSPQTIQLYAAAAKVAEGAFEFGEGRARSDLTDWTTVDPPSVNLSPRTKQLATVNIAVPSDASEGERYGVVWAEVSSAAPAGGGITAVNRVGIRIYLSVGPGGEPPSDFVIASLDARRGADGRPVLAATVHNSGGRALDLSGELRLSNGPGGLSAGPFQAKLGTTLAVGATEPVLVPLDPAIPAGPWNARILLRSGTTEREATATVTFPAAPSSSSGPVRVRRSGHNSTLPLVLGLAAVLVLILLVVLWAARRRRSRRPDPPPAISTPADPPLVGPDRRR